MYDDHPETELFVKEYLVEKNETIGDFNRDLVRKRREEKKNFAGDMDEWKKRNLMCDID